MGVDMLNSVPEVVHMRKDLHDTMEDARKLSIKLLEHEYGRFPGLDKLETVEGLDELDGFDEAVDGVNKQVKITECPRRWKMIMPYASPLSSSCWSISFS